MKTTSVAPCGMNCGICYAYLREKNKCPGCRGSDENKSVSCVRCRIKNCENLTQSRRFCFSCSSYPCARLKQLDKRYRTKYGMSMIENLENIRRTGIREFIEWEKARWKCPDCGHLICVHRKNCDHCGWERW